MAGVAGRSTSRRGWVRAIGYAGLFLAYFALARLGLTWAIVHVTVSPVWPAIGFAVGALALWGLRLWPSVFLGSFFANVLFAGAPAVVSAGIASGSTVEAVLGAMVLRHQGVVGEVGRVRDALVILLVATVTPIFGASLGVFSMTAGGFAEWREFGVLWLVWWVGESTGMLTVLPFILAWGGRRVAPALPARPIEFLGALTLVILALYVAYLRSTTLTELGIEHLPINTFLFIPLVWAVLRLRPRGVMTIVAIATALAVVFTLSVTPGPPVGALLWLQWVLLAICGGTLLLIGALTERGEAVRAAKEADRAKAQFVAVIRHDLAQPLQALQLFIAGLSGQVTGASGTAIVQRMTGTVEAMTATLDALRDVTMVEAGQVKPMPERFVVRDLLGQIADETRPQAMRKGLAFRYVPCRATIETDRQLLGRIVRNLLSNALRYTERGTILLGCHRAGRGIRIEVWDTGPGIPDAEQATVFQPFYRGRPSGKDGGVGLGLSSVKRLASILGLQLGLRSVVGKSSVFSVAVPSAMFHPQAAEGQRGEPSTANRA